MPGHLWLDLIYDLCLDSSLNFKSLKEHHLSPWKGDLKLSILLPNSVHSIPLYKADKDHNLTGGIQ